MKLRYLDSWSEGRRRNAAIYNRLFAGTPVGTPYIRPDCVSIFNQYVVNLANRDEALKALAAAGISTEVYYPLPLHLQECFWRLFRRECGSRNRKTLRSTFSLCRYIRNSRPR